MPPFLLFVTDWIEPDTNASAARQSSLLLSWSNPFNLQKPTFLFQNLYGGLDESSSLSYAVLTFHTHHSSMPLLIQRSASSSLPLVARRLRFLLLFCLIRFGRSSCSYLFPSFPFPPSPTCFSLAPVVVLLLAFCSRLLLLIIWAVVYLLSMHMFHIQIPLLSKPVSFPLRAHTRSLAFPPNFIRFRPISFFASRFICSNCVSNVLPCLDACAGSLRLVCASSFLSH